MQSTKFQIETLTHVVLPHISRSTYSCLLAYLKFDTISLLVLPTAEKVHEGFFIPHPLEWLLIKAWF
jgi:hypothetical protein